MKFEVTYYGVRGSIPVFGNQFQKYGGNTTCVLVETDDDLFIIDTGTGARELGNDLLAKAAGKPIHATILYTHTHWDHIQGFPFFVPAYIPGNSFDIYGETKEFTKDEKTEKWTIQEALYAQQNFMFFPAATKDMASEKTWHELIPNSVVEVGDTKILSFRQAHPNSSLGFRFDYQGKSFAFSTDVEFDPQTTLSNFTEYDSNVQVLAFDCQYTPEEYPDGKIGWGHSTYEHASIVAKSLGVEELHMIHHDPTHKDDMLDQMEKDAQKLFPHSRMIKEKYKFSLL